MTDPNTHNILRRRLLKTYESAKVPSLEKLRKTQWSKEFEELMRNRLLMGYFRYGPLEKQRPQQYDNIGSAIRRLNLYLETGNQEHLVDAANLCLVEFVIPSHKKAHFESTDDGEHVKPLR